MKRAEQSHSFLGMMPEVLESPDADQRCLEYLVQTRWEGAVVCPHCRGRQNIRYDDARRTWWCRGCRSRFSIRTGTILEDSRLELRKWLQACWLLTDPVTPVSSLDLVELIGVSQKTALFLHYRLASVLPRRQADDSVADKRSHIERFDEVIKRVMRQNGGTTDINLKSGECLEELEALEADSVHLAIVAPPLHDVVFQGHTMPDWAKSIIGEEKSESWEFRMDPGFHRKTQEIARTIGSSLLRPMVPGGFVVFFSQPTLAHHTAIGLEDAGLEVIDVCVWHHTRTPPAYEPVDESLIDKLSLVPTEKRRIRRQLRRMRKPSPDPTFQLLVLAQMPKQGDILDNFRRYGTGLVDIGANLLDGVRSGVISIERTSSGQVEGGLESRPMGLIEYLIRHLTRPGQVVLDPFVGSGTTALAAYSTERGCIGIDDDPTNIKTTKTRLEAAGAEDFVVDGSDSYALA